MISFQKEGLSSLDVVAIQRFCVNQVKEQVKSLPSFIEDTPDVLRTFNKLNDDANLPPGAKPISLDLKSMYTNIPIDEGLDAFREALEKRNDKTDFVLKLIELVKNILIFNEELWLQLLGTCMGTRVAPAYANLFMGVLEEKMIRNCPPHLRPFLHTWKRYIDDIFLIWLGSWTEFEEFFTFLNSYHPTIKFDEPCYNHPENSGDFLDMKICNKDGKVIADFFRKDTAKPRALLPSSETTSILTSYTLMGFRLLRICSD